MNTRIQTATIIARAIDNRLAYTTHTILKRHNGNHGELGSLDVNVDHDTGEIYTKVYF